MGVRLEVEVASLSGKPEWRAVSFSSTSKPIAKQREYAAVFKTVGMLTRFCYDCDAYGLVGVGRLEYV